MQFNVSFDTANSPDLGSLTAAEQQAVLDTANAAAAIWSRYLTPANVTLDLKIKVDNSLFGDGTLAVGSPGNFVATGNTFNGQPVYDAGSAIKLRTGQDSNGAQADLNIDLTVDSIRSMLFKTDEYAPVPDGDIDALSVFLREIDHGLGMYSMAQQPDAPGVSVYDTFVQNDAVSGEPIFTGQNAITYYFWSAPGVPLDSGSVASIDASSFYGGGAGPSLGTDLMAPVLNPDTNAHISGLDLAILQDIGVPVDTPTEGDDVVYGIDGEYVNLQGGNDTAYALPDGSSFAGDDGNDRLIGNIGNDTLEGGAGDDYLEGGGGNDILDGGTGFDIVHFSGLASDYHLTQYGGGRADIQDMRPGLHDGSEQLNGIEELQWGDGSFLLLDNAPVVTTQNVSVHSGQTIALSSLFSVNDPDGDAITAYRIYGGAQRGGPSWGLFTVDGILQQRGAVLDITPAQMPFVTFSTTSASDLITIQAFDGTLWSDWSQFNVSAHGANQAPVVNTANMSAAHDQSLALSSLFSVSDAEGDAITEYQIWDGTADPSSGHFVVDGVVQSARTVIDLTPAQLAQTSFVAGIVNDSIQIRASDGLVWSADDSAQWSPFTITVPVNHAPVVTTSSISAQHNQTLAASSLFSVSDADGDAITRYQLWDGNADPTSGYFAVGGIAQPARTVIDVSAAQLSQVSFVTGGSASDMLQIRASDGTTWSAGDSAQWSPFTITVPVNLAPVVTTANLTEQHDQTLAASSLFTVSDADSDTITKYQLWDGTADPNSGYFVVGGVAQAARTLVEITASQLAQTSFVTGNVGDNIQIRAFDGAAWSAGDSAQWSPFTITVAANHVPVVTTADLTATAGQSLTPTSLFSVSDADGDAITEYQLWDGTADPSSGHFVVGGVAQAARTVIDIPASQLGQISFLAGSTGDMLQVRAFDGRSWSAADSAQWSPFHIAVS